MEQIIKVISEKAGVSADVAKTALTHIVGFLKTKLPAAAAAQLSGLTGAAEGAPPAADLGEAVSKSGVPPEKVPAVLEAVVAQVKDKLPAGAAEQVQSALTPGGALGGLAGKVGGLFGK